jgi:IS5 family transposase
MRKDQLVVEPGGPAKSRTLQEKGERDWVLTGYTVHPYAMIATRQASNYQNKSSLFSLH